MGADEKLDDQSKSCPGSSSLLCAFCCFYETNWFSDHCAFPSGYKSDFEGDFCDLVRGGQIRVSDRSLRYWNSICSKFEKTSAFFDKHKNQLRQPHKKVFGKMIVVYAVLLVCIIVPGHLEDVLSPRYLDNISQIRRLYMRLEQIPLEKAKDYPPLFEPYNTAGE